MKVKLVNECSGSIVGIIVVQESEREVFDCHGCDPFSSMHISIDQDCGLLPLSCAPPDLKSGDGFTFKAIPDLQDCRVRGMRRLKALDETNMIYVWMIRSEPRSVHTIS